MFAYVWKEIDKGLTSRYHSGGGLLIIARDLPRAQELWANYPVDEDDWWDDPRLKSLPNPDLSLALKNPTASEEVCIMPDAGCC